MPSLRHNSVCMSADEIVGYIRDMLLTNNALTEDERETIRAAEYSLFAGCYDSDYFFCFHPPVGGKRPAKNSHLGLSWTADKVITALMHFTPFAFFKGKHPSIIGLRSLGADQYEFFNRAQVA